MTEKVFQIEKATREDLKEIVEITSRTRLGDWTEQDYLQYLKKDGTLCLVNKDKEKITGFLMMSLIMQNSHNVLSDIISTAISTATNDSASRNNSNNNLTKQNTAVQKPVVKVDDPVKRVCIAEVLKIAVSKEFQGQGIGSALLLKSFEKLKCCDSAEVWLEVRESNRTAIDFYRAHGFCENSKRKNYYCAPSENAVVMVKRL